MLERVRERRLLELGLAPRDQLLELAAHHVAGLAEQGAHLGGQSRDRAQQLGERALAAQRRDPRLLEGDHVRGVKDRLATGEVERRERGSLLPQLLQLCVVHGHPFAGAAGRENS